MKVNYSILFISIFFTCLGLNIKAEYNIQSMKESNKEASLLIPSEIFDLQQSTKSNIQFYTTNYGLFGSDIKNSKGGVFWPRDTKNQYIFGAGIWFGAMKKDSIGTLKKLVEMSYNINSGHSWFVPGRIGDSEFLDNYDKDIYGVYISTYFDKNGIEITGNSYWDWPIWFTGIEYEKFGSYVDTFVNRNSEKYPQGPAYISDEDFFSTYKDTDLSYFEGSVGNRKIHGYPMNLQFEQTIYSWDNEELKDAAIIIFKAINKSNDTLWNCWMAPVFDIDIIYSDSMAGIFNDKSRYYKEDTSLNLGITWSDTNFGEAGKGFGYIGTSLLMSPAVDNNKFVISGKDVYDTTKQIGLVTFWSWDIADDIMGIYEIQIYDFMSSRIIHDTNSANDKRVMLASGPFNLAPNQEARVAILINFALPAQNTEADGSTADLANLIKGLKTAREYFYGDMITSISERETRLNNSGFDISKPYPNPASDEARLDMYMKEGGYVSIEIDNLMGQNVIPPISKYYLTGMNQLNFDLRKLPAGQYYIKINNGYKIMNKLLTVLK